MDANVVTAPCQRRTELIMCFLLVVTFNFMFAGTLQGQILPIIKVISMFLFILLQKKSSSSQYYLNITKKEKQVFKLLIKSHLKVFHIKGQPG